MFANQDAASHATNYLGAAMIDFVSKACGSYNVFEIGHLNQDSYITASKSAGKFGSYCEVRWIASTATYTNDASGLRILNICGGGNAVIASTNALPQRIMFSENGGTLKTRIVDNAKIDPSAVLTMSEFAPIVFDDEGEDYTWETALASSNKGGFVKKGEGTLTLKEVPQYTGDTYLDGGTLKIPASAGVRVKTHDADMRVQKSSETIDEVEYTVYRLIEIKPGTVIRLI
jgi:autotransporter-associated beta strand protein